MKLILPLISVSEDSECQSHQSQHNVADQIEKQTAQVVDDIHCIEAQGDKIRIGLFLLSEEEYLLIDPITGQKVEIRDVIEETVEGRGVLREVDVQQGQLHDELHHVHDTPQHLKRGRPKNALINDLKSIHCKVHNEAPIHNRCKGYLSGLSRLDQNI